MPEQSSLQVQESRGVRVIGFVDPNALDTFNVVEVGKELLQVIQRESLRLIVLDMSTIHMLSSQSLGLFLSIRQIVSEKGGKLAICGLDGRLFRVFKITNLQNMFDFHENVENAAAALRL